MRSAFRRLVVFRLCRSFYSLFHKPFAVSLNRIRIIIIIILVGKTRLIVNLKANQVRILGKMLRFRQSQPFTILKDPGMVYTALDKPKPAKRHRVPVLVDHFCVRISLHVDAVALQPGSWKPFPVWKFPPAWNL